MKFQNPITLLFKQNNGKSQICLEQPDYRNGWLCGLRLRSACQRNRLPCQTDDIGTIWGCQCGHFLSWWTNWPSIFLKSRTSTEVVLLRKSCSPQVVIASFNDQEYRNWDRTKSWWSQVYHPWILQKHSCSHVYLCVEHASIWPILKINWKLVKVLRKWDTVVMHDELVERGREA